MDLILRENSALVSVLLFAFLAVIMLRVVLQDFRLFGREAYANHLTQVSIALFFFSIAESIYRLWIYGILKVFNDGNSPAWFKEHWHVAAIASGALIVCLLCLVRLFSPDRWKLRGFLVAAGLSALAVAINVIL